MMVNMRGSTHFTFYYQIWMIIGYDKDANGHALPSAPFGVVRSQLLPLAVELLRRVLDDGQDGFGVGRF